MTHVEAVGEALTVKSNRWVDRASKACPLTQHVLEDHNKDVVDADGCASPSSIHADAALPLASVLFHEGAPDAVVVSRCRQRGATRRTAVTDALPTVRAQRVETRQHLCPLPRQRVS